MEVALVDDVVFALVVIPVGDLVHLVADANMNRRIWHVRQLNLEAVLFEHIEWHIALGQGFPNFLVSYQNIQKVKTILPEF